MSDSGEVSTTSSTTNSTRIPAPLHIVKNSNQRLPPSRQHRRSSSEVFYVAGRRLSIKRQLNKDRHILAYHIPEKQDHQQSESASIYSTQSTKADKSSSSSDHKLYTPMAFSSEEQNNPLRLTETSLNMLGDFVAIDTEATDSEKLMENPFVRIGKVRVPSNTRSKTDQLKAGHNPYEFERSPLFEDLHRQTTFSTFSSGDGDTRPASRQYHVKNSRSNGSTHLSPQQKSFLAPTQTPRGRNLQRSESSPNIGQGSSVGYHPRSPSPDIPAYYYGELDTPVASKKKSNRARELPGRNRAHTISNSRIGEESDFTRPRDPMSYQEPSRSQPSTHTPAEYAGTHGARLASVTVPHRQTQASASNSARNSKDSHTTSSKSSMGARYAVDAYGDVTKIDNPTRHMSPSPEPLCLEEVSATYPKKRSRSPMKKMFGENGWLGRSPNETFEESVKKNSTSKRQSQSSKSTMMSKIKTKIEGFAEKADFNPNKHYRNNSTKSVKTTTLTVSLSPPEQARIYMELELMLVHTANGFLMTQFSQGRIAIDSIKKTSDMWKNKGRPSVIEFMYDQATQRDLVAVNQHTFRFYGERAGDGIRINSMLYNWKQVASHMVIRTFCNADTVILKLLFDIGQILELLGATEGILLRHQSIRMSVNARVHSSRMKSNNTQSVVGGGNSAWKQQEPTEQVHAGTESSDVYGGFN